MGNEKANSYWESLLPPDSDRSHIEEFIRAKYQEKKWVSEDAELINMISERHSNCDKATEGGARIPRRARKYSLEEEILNTNMSQIASTTRLRWASVDMSHMTDKLIIESPPNDNSLEKQPSITSDTATDLFSLLYAPEVLNAPPLFPPSFTTYDEIDISEANTDQHIYDSAVHKIIVHMYISHLLVSED
nr:probable ADP-ribosylation factor GTPase-activating protein AGD15 [Ipomoea batatas]